MATGITYDTFSERPYLTVAEYKNAPTAIDIDNLVVNGNAQAQDNELARVILRASSYMDEYFNQNLVATQNVETQRVRMNGEGYISLHPFHNPIVSLEAFLYGATPNQLYALGDCSTAWFEDQQIIIPVSNLLSTWTSQGPLQFGIPSNGNRIFVKYTYVAGFANTTIATAASAGATSITVDDGTGIVAGQMLRIYDTQYTEIVYVASTYTYGSKTVPITTALVYSHQAGIAIGNLPNAIKEACILITTAFLKARGDGSLSMGISSRPSGTVQGANLYGSEIKLALDMVDKYRRVR
jgi:hypothetical protein